MMMVGTTLFLSLLTAVTADGGHVGGVRKTHAHPRVGNNAHGGHSVAAKAEALPTQDFVAPEYFKCFNQVNGAFYFYDTTMLREYVTGKVAASPLRPSKEKCDFLTQLTDKYNVYEVTLQPDIGRMKFAVGTNPSTKRQQMVACDAISWDFSKASDGVLCTAELARDVNNAKTQAFIGNIADPRFKGGH